MNLPKAAPFLFLSQQCRNLLVLAMVCACLGPTSLFSLPLTTFQILPPDNYPTNVDIGMHGIFLYFRKSTEEVLGKDIKFIQQADKTSVLECYNSNYTQIMRLIHHPKAQVNSVQEYEVEGVTPKAISPAQCVFKEVKDFETYRGVKLGMSINEVTSIFGDDFKAQSTEGVITVRYTIESNVNSRFMARYNRQRYYGTYVFQTGKLIKYSFGFDRRF